MIKEIQHYQIIDQLGSGGMGVVYRALDSRLGRKVALKFLQNTQQDATAKARMLAEAQIAASLDHPNIGVIHSIEEHDGQPFIVMTLYEGISLRERLKEGRLELEPTLDIIRQTAEGLATAHAKGIIHRDIKPENLLLASGLVKILDFGLAKQANLEPLSSSGMLVGTLAYMSPEQVRGQQLDFRTDLWSLGVIFYEMLSGFSPFQTEGPLTAGILKIIKEEPPTLSEFQVNLPGPIEAIMQKLLTKDPDLRYASGLDLIRDLQRIDGANSKQIIPKTKPASKHPDVRLEPASKATTRTILPQTKTALIGRQNELSIIAHHLADPHCRILTLFGPGGTGKTRLVLEAARQISETGMFATGIYFVSLDALEDPDLIAPNIAKVLELNFQSQVTLIEELQEAIGEQSILLILDNYEHVMEGARLPGELVSACPNLKILVTSRERLNLEDEWVLPIPGLDIPETDLETTDKAEQYDSVQLFVTRAKRANLNFKLEPESAADICVICRLVAGSPLGIELAAAWVKMMPCRDIAREIQNNLDFLTSTSRDVIDRHKSIKAIFDYSWTLLSTAEQEAFKRLALFHGPFSREAAEAVTETSLPILMFLVDKSLLHSADGSYESHPLLQQYALKKLAESPEEQKEIEIKFANYFLQELQKLVGQYDELAKLDDIIDNVLAAVQSASTQGQGKLLVEFMHLLAVDGNYFAARGYTPRSLELLKSACEAAKRRGELNLAHRFLGKLGDTYRLSLGDFDKGFEAYKESLDLAKQIQNTQRQAITLSAIGHTRFLQKANDASAYLDQGLKIAIDSKDPIALFHVLQHQALLLGESGKWEEAKKLFEKALKAARMAYKQDNSANNDIIYYKFIGLINLGEAEKMLKNFDESLEIRRQAYAIAQETNNKVWQAMALQQIGEIYHSMNEKKLAQKSFSTAMKLWKTTNNYLNQKHLKSLTQKAGYSMDVMIDE